MRFAANILTPMTAFCLFGSESDWAPRQKQFDQPIVEKATAESTVADTAFLAVHCNEQTEDPLLAHVSTQSKGPRSSSEALQEPIFLKQPLLFTPNGLKLSAPSRKTLKFAAAWLRQHRESQLLIVGYCDASGSLASSKQVFHFTSFGSMPIPVEAFTNSCTLRFSRWHFAVSTRHV